MQGFKPVIWSIFRQNSILFVPTFEKPLTSLALGDSGVTDGIKARSYDHRP